MNLFKTLLDILSKDSDVTIVVRKTGDATLAVSTALKNNSTTDPAKDAIAPFVVSGTAEELDAEFVSLITTPMEKSAGLQTSMANFEASAKAAQAASKAASEAKRKEEDAKKAAKANVTALLNKAKGLLDEKKYGEAKAAYTKAKAEAEKAGLAAEKGTAQKGIDTCAKQDAPDMFASFGEETDTTCDNDEGGAGEEPEPEDGTDTAEPDPDEDPEGDPDPEEDTTEDPSPLNFGD